MKLGEGDAKEAWRVVQGWYRDVEDRGPTPCRESMTRQTKEQEELYTKVEPPGEPIPINVEPYSINDETPGDAELRYVVPGMRNGRAGRVSGIRAEHMKEWLAGVREEEEQGNEGKGDQWRAFVKLIQTIWDEGCLPQ